MPITHNFFSPFIPQTFRQTSHTSRMLSHRSLPGWLLISLSLNSSKTEFLLIGLKRQLAKIHNPSISIVTTQSARNLGFIFDEHLSFSGQISVLSKSCNRHIRALCCIRPYTLTFTAPKRLPPPSYTPSLTTVTLYYGLPKCQINSLQHIQNALARTVVQAPKFQYHSYSEISSLT